MQSLRMYASFKFDREIDPEKDFISLGEVELVTGGKTIVFDFLDYAGTVDKFDKTVVNTVRKNPDYHDYKCLDNLTEKDLMDISKIEKIDVYTAEDQEDPPQVLSVFDVAFEAIDGATYVDSDGTQESVVRQTDYIYIGNDKINKNMFSE